MATIEIHVESYLDFISGEKIEVTFDDALVTLGHDHVEWILEQDDALVVATRYKDGAWMSNNMRNYALYSCVVEWIKEDVLECGDCKVVKRSKDVGFVGSMPLCSDCQFGTWKE